MSIRTSAYSKGLVQDWAELDCGEQIKIYRHTELVSAGTVDATMPDGTGVWLIQYKGLGRKLFDKSEDLWLRKTQQDS